MITFCTYCGNEIEDGALFCTKCGRRVATTQTIAPTEHAEAKTTDAAQSKVGSFDFRSWIVENGLEAYEDALRSQDCDTKEVLATLADGDLERIGISIGGRRKILIAIEKLKTPPTADVQANAQTQSGGATTATQSAAGEADTAQSATSDAEHNKTIQSLQAEHEKEIKNLEESYGGIIQNLTEGKTYLKIANIFGWILLAVFVGVAIYYSSKYNSARRSNEELLAGLSSPVHVVINRVYNAANNSTTLKHEEITYLSFDYTVLRTSSVSNSETLYVKVINPDGSLATSTSSPSGYSFSVAMNSVSTGWGRDTAGSYRTSGNYTIEFWYKEVCVGRSVVRIN